MQMKVNAHQAGPCRPFHVSGHIEANILGLKCLPCISHRENSLPSAPKRSNLPERLF